jgi:hypothetical protein
MREKQQRKTKTGFLPRWSAPPSVDIKTGLEKDTAELIVCEVLLP